MIVIIADNFRLLLLLLNTFVVYLEETNICDTYMHTYIHTNIHTHEISNSPSS